MARPDQQPPCVTIFGAGVTGLTAAHELIERGFRVQVWEPELNPRNPERGCEVGGLARTQWGAVAWPDDVANGRVQHPTKELKDRGTHPLIRLPQKFYFDEHDRKITKAYALGESGSGDPTEVVRELLHAVVKHKDHIDHFYCEVFSQTLTRKRGQDEVVELAKQVVAFLKREANKTGHVVQIHLEEPGDAETIDSMSATLEIDEFEPIQVNIQLLDFEPEGLPAQAKIALRFRVRERWIPGEHGFRFFPAFYSHVFDSMKRTPILGAIEKPELEFAQERSVGVNATRARFGSTGRTVYDNITPTTKQGIAFGNGFEPAVLSRSLPTSFEEFMDWVRVVFGTHDRSPRGLAYGTMGATTRDIAQFQLRMFQYLTSSEARRKEYEEVSWLDFLCGGRPPEEVFSEKFRDAITTWPEALVALSAEEADARTQGSVSVQLLLDNVRPKSFRDGTLNGPTNIAWLDPWRRYLEYQGVEFIHGKLEGFEVVGGRVWPKVRCYEPRYPGALDRTPALLPGYFLLALPATEAWRLSRSYIRVRKDASLNPDLVKMASYPLLDEVHQGEGSDAKDQTAILLALAKRQPSKELRHMIGIQYYFAEDLEWLDGHVTYPDAPFRISSISQPRFWQERHDWEHGHRGVLSVIVTRPNDWADLDRESLATNVWNEIQTAVTAGGRPLPEPLYWHVDDAFVSQKQSDDDQGRLIRGEKPAHVRNRTPVQVQLAGRWDLRPGEAVEPYAKPNVLSGYSVADGVVLAGTFMKTFTRLTTMEAANESARHAVNAILQAEAKREAALEAEAKGAPPAGSDKAHPSPSACEIFPLDTREPRDLAFLKEIDAELHRRGLEHFVDILDLGELVAHGLSGRPRDPFNVEGLLEPLAGIIRDTAARFSAQGQEQPGA